MSDGRVTLTDDESIDTELLIEQLVHNPVERSQLAAELVILRKLFAACRRDRQRLPVQARKVVDRFPLYSRTTTFQLQSTNRLELEAPPCRTSSTRATR